MQTSSIYSYLGIPNEIGAAIVLFSLCLLMTPWLGGKEVGPLKIPQIGSEKFKYVLPSAVILLSSSLICFFPFIEERKTYVYFPELKDDVIEPKVVREDLGETQRFTVTFVNPTESAPGHERGVSNRIAIYGRKPGPTGFHSDETIDLGIRKGVWPPGATVLVSFDAPAELLRAKEGWKVWLCIGDEMGCVVSPNLLP